jgi:hypothetical protein
MNYGITATRGVARGGGAWMSDPVRTGRVNSAQPGGTTVMGIIVLSFLLLLTAASAIGWTADSRDSADWKPSDLLDSIRSRTCSRARAL